MTTASTLTTARFPARVSPKRLAITAAIAFALAGTGAAAEGPRPMERLMGAFNIPGSGSLVLPDLADQDCNFVTMTSDPDTELYLIDFIAAQNIFFGGKECDPLQDIRKLLDPDGNPITLWDWLQARGRVKITCVDGGARYQFKFKNLVPHSIYTIWHFPGTGAGALASHPPDDINNVFVANESGNATLIVTGTPGPMTMGGQVPACTLPSSEFAAGGGPGGNVAFTVI